MFRYAVYKLSDKYTEEEIAGFNNQKTLEENSLYRYPKDRLVVVENYCLLIDDLARHYIANNRLENPYTRRALPAEVLAHPHFSCIYKATEAYQLHIAPQIRAETRRQLALLAKGILNPQEIGCAYGDMPLAQSAYLRFNEYYQSLRDDERNALNDYRISGWSFMLPGILGMGPTTFGNLYESLDRSCGHSVAGSCIQLLIQLDPNTQFDCSSCPQMAMMVETFRFRNQLQPSAIPQPPVQGYVLGMV